MGHPFRQLLKRTLLPAALLVPALSQAQSWQWASVNTASASVNIRSGGTALAIDAAGNTTIAGFFKGDITFGSTTLTGTTTGTNDLFIARFTPAGVCSQAVAIPTNGALATIRAMVILADGTTVIGGETQGRLRFGPTLSAFSSSGTVSFIARLSPSNVWTQVVTGGAGSQINALAADGQGNVAVTGFFDAPRSIFGTATLTGSNSTGHNDLFIARLNNAGNWTQAVQATGVANSRGNAISLDGNGTVTVAGNFDRGPVTIGTTTLPNIGGASGNTGTDILVVRLNSGGSWTQAVSAGGPDTDTANALAVDAGGTAVIGGMVQNGAMFGTFSPLQSYQAAYVARLDASGVWQQASTQNNFTPQQLVLSSQGDVFTSGSQGFGAIYRVSAAGQWMPLAGIGAAGGTAHSLGGLAQDRNGDLVVTGQLGSSASFDNISVNPDGRFMYFAARLGGVALSTRQNSSASQLHLFPQPAHNVVTIAGADGDGYISDALGRKVLHFQATRTETTLNISNLEPGLYFLHNGTTTKRLEVL